MTAADEDGGAVSVARCQDCEWTPRWGVLYRPCKAHTCPSCGHSEHPGRRCGKPDSCGKPVNGRRRPCECADLPPVSPEAARWAAAVLDLGST